MLFKIKNHGLISNRPMHKLRVTNKAFELLRQSILLLIGTFIFFNPFPHTTAVKEICFYLSVLIVLILYLFKKKDFDFKTPFMLSFGLFVAWSFIGLFFALDKNNSIHDFYSHLLRYIILYYIIINLFSSKRRLVDLSWIIIISIAIFSIGGIIYFYFILGNNILTERFIGFTQISFPTVVVTAMFAMILSLNNLFNETTFYRKIILIVCLFSAFFSIVLSQSLSSLVSLCLVVVIIFSNKKKFLIVLLGIILIIVIITPFKNRLVSHYNRPLIGLRVGINYTTFEVIKDYPIMGIGFGMETFGKDLDLKKYNERVPEKYRENYIYNDPHNMFFDIAVRLGIVGFVLFFYIIFVFFKMCWDIIKYGNDDFIKNWGRCLAAAFVSFLVIGFFHPVLNHMPETILCVMFSMLTIVWRLNNEQLSKDVA